MNMGNDLRASRSTGGLFRPPAGRTRRRGGLPAAAVVATLWSLGVAAQQEPQTPEPAQPAPAEPGPEAQPQPPRPRSGESNDVFIPSEELSADEEVTFPVDI